MHAKYSKDSYLTLLGVIISEEYHYGDSKKNFDLWMGCQISFIKRRKKSIFHYKILTISLSIARNAFAVLWVSILINDLIIFEN